MVVNTAFHVEDQLPGVYERVLFPTDGSDGAEAATGHALELARRFDAPMHVLYVVDVTVAHASDAYSGPTLDALTASGESVVEAVRERAEAAGVDVTTTVTEGTPAKTIVETADPGDVTVMGTHGRTGLDRYLVGSTTEKVVRTAGVPVVTVPVTMEETDGE